MSIFLAQIKITYGSRQREKIGVKSGISAYKYGIEQKLDQNGESKSNRHRI